MPVRRAPSAIGSAPAKRCLERGAKAALATRAAFLAYSTWPDEGPADDVGGATFVLQVRHTLAKSILMALQFG